MKKIIALLMVGVMVLGLFAGCGAPDTTAPTSGNEGNQGGNQGGNQATDVADVTEVTLKVWTPQEEQVSAVAWLCQMQAQFQDAHPEYKITWDNGVCPEDAAATLVTMDPAVAADVYLFESEDLDYLIQAGALAKLEGPYLEQVQSDVSVTYVNTVTYSDGGVYGFPVAPKTWFMYYNKALVGDADLSSLESILEKGVVAFPIYDGRFLSSFFFAAGCSLFGETGADAAAGIQFGGEAGYNATNAILDLMDNPNFKVDGNGYGNAGLKDGTVAAYFSGSWDYAGLFEALGENLGAVAVPTVMINGGAAQLKAFACSTAVGVNPHAENRKAAMQFAAFLASNDSQLLRFQLRGITPAVTALSENAEVAASIVAAAESATMAYASVAEPTIPEMGSVWVPVATFGNNIIERIVNRDNVQEMVDLLDGQLNGGL